MEIKTIGRVRPEHEVQRMKMVPVADGAQFRFTCNKCGTWLVMLADNQRNGTADCTGKTIYLAWGE